MSMLGFVKANLQRKTDVLSFKIHKMIILGKCQIPITVKLLRVKGIIPKYTPGLNSQIITHKFSGTKHLL